MRSRFFLFAFYIVIILCSSSYSFSQRNRDSVVIDSLRRGLPALADTDTNRVNQLNAIFRAMVTSYNIDSAIEIAHEAYDLSTKIDFESGKLKSTWNLGNGYNVKGDYTKAIHYYEEYNLLQSRRGDMRGIAKANNNIGVVYYYLGEYNKADLFWQNAEKSYRLVNDTANVNYAGIINNLGSCNLEWGQDMKAVKYYYRAFEIFENLKKPCREYASNLENLGIYFLKVGKDTTAMGYFKSAKDMFEKSGYVDGMIGVDIHFGDGYLKRGDIHLALQSYKTALKLSENLAQPKCKAKALVGLGDYYLGTGFFDKADSCFQASMQICVENNFKPERVQVFEKCADVMIGRKKYNESLSLLMQGLKLASDISARSKMLELYGKIADTYEKNGNLKEALEYQKKYQELNKSLYNIVTLEEQINSVNDYQNQKQKRINAEKDRDLATNDAKLLRFKQQRTVFIAFGIVISLVVLLLILILRQNRSWARELEKKNMEIGIINSNLEKIVEDKTKNLKDLNSELDGFLYESAHALRRPLTTISALVDLMDKEKDPVAKETLRQQFHFTRIRMDNMLHKLILVNENSRKSPLQESFDLHILIDGIVQGLEKGDTPFYNNIPAGTLIESDKFRISVILRNVIENAFQFHRTMNEDQKENRTDVFYSQNENSFVIRVKDTGMGILPSAIPHLFEMFYRGTEKSKGTGLGLFLTKKMVDRLGGTIEVHSEPDAFTEFIISIPFTKA